MDKKDLIEKTMNVTEKIQHVEPSSQLMERLRAIPDRVIEVYDRVPRKVIWSAVASIIILIAINMYSARKYSNSQAESYATGEGYFDYLKHI